MTTLQPVAHTPLPYRIARAERRCQRCLGESGNTPQLVGLRRAGYAKAWKRAVLCDPCVATAGDEIAGLHLVRAVRHA